MLQNLIALAFAVFFIVLANAEKCSVAHPSKMMRLSIRSIRNDTGEWVTKFTTCGGADTKVDGMAVDISQNIVNCGGVEVVKIEGYLASEVDFKGTAKHHILKARMAEETSTFKASLYLEGSSGKNEVRRFVLPKNASTDFLFLEEKLKTVFQSLKSLPFSVMWEDSEGVEVLISSDEELKIAINEMKGEVNRLKIEAKSAIVAIRGKASTNVKKKQIKTGEGYLALEVDSERTAKHRILKDNKTEEDVPPQPLHFHERTGANVQLSNGKRTAARREYKEPYYGGSMITNRPLKDDELFEVRFDKIIDNWGSFFSLGVTVANPTTFSFKGHWASFNDGVWLYLRDSIFHNGNYIQRGYGIHLGTLKVGDRVGVMRKSNGSLHFFVNGIDQGAIPTTVPETVYGVMDLYENNVQATIVKP